MESGTAAAAVGGQSLRTMAILSTPMAFASISTDMYLPAMPAMAAALGSDAGRLEWTISGYLVGFSLGQLAWGPLSDRYGRRLPILHVASWRAIFWTLVAVGLGTLAALSVLPETLAAGRRTRAPLSQSLRAYLGLLRHRRLLGYAGGNEFRLQVAEHNLYVLRHRSRRFKVFHVYPSIRVHRYLDDGNENAI